MDLFKKKIDRRDPYYYLPCDKNLGTERWWAEKFGNKLPDGYLFLLETLSRKEYDDQDVESAKQLVRRYQLEFNAQIEKEMAELGMLNQQKYDENISEDAIPNQKDE